MRDRRNCDWSNIVLKKSKNPDILHHDRLVLHILDVWESFTMDTMDGELKGYWKKGSIHPHCVAY